MSIPKVSVGGVVTNLVLAVLSLTAVSLRFYARKSSKQPLKSDDWIIFVCLVCSSFHLQFLLSQKLTNISNCVDFLYWSRNWIYICRQFWYIWGLSRNHDCRGRWEILQSTIRRWSHLSLRIRSHQDIRRSFLQTHLQREVFQHLCKYCPRND